MYTHIYIYIHISRGGDKFTPTKHLTPPPHHSSRPAAAYTDTETPYTYIYIRFLTNPTSYSFNSKEELVGKSVTLLMHTVEA